MRLRSSASALIGAVILIGLLCIAGLALGARPRGITAVSGVSVLTTSSCAPHSNSCISIGTTYAAAGYVANEDVVPVTRGVAGKAVPLASTEDPNGAACSSVGVCWLAGGDYSASTPGGYVGALIPFAKGKLGTPHLFPSLQDFQGGISCPTKTVCWASAVGSAVGSAYVVRFNPVNGSAHIYALKTHDAIFSAGEGGDHAFVCTSQTVCKALGRTNFNVNSEGLETTLTDGRITSLVGVRGTSAFAGLACPSATVCEGVGSVTTTTSSRAVFVRFTKTTASKPIAAPTTTYLAGVSCFSLTKCDGVGLDAHGTTDNGVISRLSGKTARTTIAAKGGFLGADTCLSSTLCWAVGSLGTNPHEKAILDGFTP